MYAVLEPGQRVDLDSPFGQELLQLIRSYHRRAPGEPLTITIWIKDKNGTWMSSESTIGPDKCTQPVYTTGGSPGALDDLEFYSHEKNTT